MFRLNGYGRQDGTRLGRILKDLGYCDDDDLEVPNRSPWRLGERLVEAGTITPEQLDHALTRQRVLRGKADPAVLKRFGADGRKRALGEMAERLRVVAESAGLLAAKVRG